MYFDGDIKIANLKSSYESSNVQADDSISKADSLKAKNLGAELAEIFLKDASNFLSDEDGNFEMIIERRVLLYFTVTVALDRYLKSKVCAEIARNGFENTLKSIAPEIAKTCLDTGAFSFYFLAYRRGAEVVRRIGQTFAMLCSHDGDSVYQELGEALYCWFSAVVKENIEKYGLQA